VKKKIIALTCCRQNSKGIKNKNIKLFSGKPLLYWTAKNTIKSNIFDKIYLSTDGKKIAKLGKKYGYEVPELRPKKLAGNKSDVFETHKYFFKKMNINDKNSLICIINNNPFINSNMIEKSFKIFKKNNYKSIVMGAIKVSSDQIYFRQMKKKKNSLYPFFSKKLVNSGINRKDYNTYFNTGDIRWGKPSWLINYKKFNIILSKKGFRYFEINEMEYQDLNILKDWKEAVLKFKNL
jgi:CMP-N-acetylneuraminic acid synthetase|tara:strand:- start:1054 stop:1761 length:708 start_codon:yes stop_codon:yes gene_type:complete